MNKRNGTHFVLNTIKRKKQQKEKKRNSFGVRCSHCIAYTLLISVHFIFRFYIRRFHYVFNEFSSRFVLYVRISFIIIRYGHDK